MTTTATVPPMTGGNLESLFHQGGSYTPIPGPADEPEWCLHYARLIILMCSAGEGPREGVGVFLPELYFDEPDGATVVRRALRELAEQGLVRTAHPVGEDGLRAYAGVAGRKAAEDAARSEWAWVASNSPWICWPDA